MIFPLREKSDSGAPPTTKAIQFPPSGLFNIYRILSRLDGISPKAIIRIIHVISTEIKTCDFPDEPQSHLINPSHEHFAKKWNTKPDRKCA